jgi:hypothetical protein
MFGMVERRKRKLGMGEKLPPQLIKNWIPISFFISTKISQGVTGLNSHSPIFIKK